MDFDYSAEPGYFGVLVDGDGNTVVGVAKCSTVSGWALVRATDEAGRALPGDKGGKTRWRQLTPPLKVLA